MADRYMSNMDLHVACRVLPLRLRRESQMIKYVSSNKNRYLLVD